MDTETAPTDATAEPVDIYFDDIAIGAAPIGQLTPVR